MISYHFIVQSCYIIIDLIPYVYLISLRPIYPITRNMYLLIPHIYFCPTPYAPPFWQAPGFSLQQRFLFLFCLFIRFAFQIPCISEIVHCSSFLVSLTSLSKIPSRLICVVESSKISTTWLSNNVCVYIYTRTHTIYHLVYLFAHQRALRLLPYLGPCK